MPLRSGPLQEVAPPAAVQQLSEALALRQPRVRILEPNSEALLNDQPWTLKLAVEDWPLVDAGALGIGPHLNVQIDDQPPLTLLDTTLTLPPLSPGSHRVSVYAVRPWGEAVKAPGASDQIRVHRSARNPLALPASGSPQLLSVSPAAASPDEPILLDWLLIDAPLQNLRADDARWRLRLTVNGDSILVNQQTPLWLRGWKSGTNAVLLELVDGRGEPLNPPFNSLVREVRLDRTAPRPAWLGAALNPDQLAALLGNAPPPQAETPEARQQQSAPPALEPLPSPSPEPTSSQSGAAAPAEVPSAAAPTDAPEAETPEPAEGKPISGVGTAEERSEPTGSSLEGSETIAPQQETQPTAPTAEAPDTAGDPEPTPAERETQEANAAVEASGAALPPAIADGPTEALQPDPDDGAIVQPARAEPHALPAGPESTESGTEVVPSDTSLPRPAREEVNPDGTLIRPAPSGRWQALKTLMSR